jgi:hypothetical protein
MENKMRWQWSIMKNTKLSVVLLLVVVGCSMLVGCASHDPMNTQTMPWADVPHAAESHGPWHGEPYEPTTWQQ